MTPLNIEVPPNRLLELVAKVIVLHPLKFLYIFLESVKKCFGSEMRTGSCSGEQWDIERCFFISLVTFFLWINHYSSNSFYRL